MIDYKKELNERQFEAVMYNDGPLVIIATAGSGKTRTLTYKTAKLLEDGIKPENILLLTFTNRAAKEMINRISSMLGEEASNVTACTYHSFCVELLRKYIGKIGYDNNFTILGQTDSEDAITLLKTDYPEQEEKDFPTSKQFLSAVSLAKNKELPLSVIIKNDDKMRKYESVLLDLNEKYTDYKEERNLLDYNDIIYLTNMVLELNPSVRKELSEQYQYKMIDEYQDTSSLQAHFIKNLCMYGNDKITVVGDDAQAIFSFSGAEPKNILEFPGKFKDCKTIILEENYRSTPEIIQVANRSIAAMKEKYNKVMKTNRPSGNKVILYRPEDSLKEADYVFRKIGDACHYDYSKIKDTAIISRRSFDSFYLESMLLKNKIPYKKFGGLKFCEKVYVRDILAYMKVIINHKDEIAWFRLLNLCEGIGPATAKNIIHEILVNGIDELKSNKYEKKKFENDLIELHDALEKLKTKNLEKQIDFLLNYYFKEKSKRIMRKKISSEKRNRELNANDKDWEESEILRTISTGYTKAEDFLADLVLEQPDDKEKANLTISTIHSAKGMEFDTVFYMNCINFNTEKTPEEYEEARRCYYVAITRAKNNLFITAPQYATKYNGNYIKNELSPYVTESIR